MKKLSTVLLVLLAACHRGGVAGSATGASSPEGAVNAFLAAAKAQDLQAMSVVWGTTDGPVRATMPRDELDKREIIMIRLLCQADGRVVGKSPGPSGHQLVRVELKRATAAVEVNFTTVQGPRSRWYVLDFENSRLQALCRSGAPAPR